MGLLLKACHPNQKFCQELQVHPRGMQEMKYVFVETNDQDGERDIFG